MNNTRMTKMYSLFIEWKESSLSFFLSFVRSFPRRKFASLPLFLPSLLPPSLRSAKVTGRASKQTNNPSTRRSTKTAKTLVKPQPTPAACLNEPDERRHGLDDAIEKS